VQAAVDRFGLKYPIVLDNDMFIWRSFDNHYWPAKYLFTDGARLLDHRGGDLGGANTRAKYHHYGEGEYRETELQIQELLRAAGVKAEFPPPMKPVRELDGVAARGAVCYPVTHELYTNRRGWHQDQWGHDVEFFRSRRYPAHEDVGVYSEGRAYLRGTWQLTEQYARHPVTTRNYEDFLLIRYKAVEVNAVIHLHAGKGPVRVKVTLDGKPLPRAKAGADVIIDEGGDSFLEVSEARMYNIVNSKEWGIHNLALYPRDDGFAVYAFTFGSCLKPDARPLFGPPLPNPDPAPPPPPAPNTPRTP
jgi:hypothetical protein